jgi:hypothetical protein
MGSRRCVGTDASLRWRGLAAPDATNFSAGKSVLSAGSSDADIFGIMETIFSLALSQPLNGDDPLSTAPLSRHASRPARRRFGPQSPPMHGGEDRHLA